MKKLYINITNHCNASCPFCCMYSNQAKNDFMTFDKLYEIMAVNSDKEVIVQLEGGEPLTHPNFVLFVEFLSIAPNVREIVIDTNAFLLREYIDKIVDSAERNKKLITVKPSYNSYLKDLWAKKYPYTTFSDYLRNTITSCEFLNYVKFKINVRAFNDEELTSLSSELGEIMEQYIEPHLFNSYGLLSDNETLPKLTINKVFEEWECFNSKGESFGQDLIARSESEK